jgi:histidinol-phosphate aminotransferase
MKARGILVRDRSSDWGCEGCVRITAGWQAHTDRLLTALHDTLKEIGWTGYVSRNDGKQKRTPA